MNLNEKTERSGDARQVWGSADLARLGGRHVLCHEILARSIDVHPGEQVLDVGTGGGNLAIAAARRGGIVTATDIVPDVLPLAVRRAESDGLSLTTEIADAAQLPYPDDSFDVVLSSFAVIFAPDARQAAGELIRVCRPGGRIGLTAWTPDGFVGHQLGVLRRYQRAEAGPRPADWSDEGWLRNAFDQGVAELRIETRAVDMCFLTADLAIAEFRVSLGPVRATFDALDATGQAALAADMKQVVQQFNRAADGTIVVPAEYREIIVVLAD